MSNVPDHLLCPITQSIMVNPVIADDGYTYERDAIIHWVNQKGISPMTRQPLNIHTIRPNRLIIDLIDQYSNPSLASMNRQSISSITTSDVHSIVLNTNIKYIKSSFDHKVYIYSQTIPESTTTDKRIPTSVICVIDVSGSMGTLCSEKTDSESDGLSRLDLTKHSLNTIIETLNEFDELVIIKFTNTAECMFEGKMSSFGKSDAKRIVTKLQPENSTNIWGGINMGYTYAKRSTNSNVKMLLLTDGVSNINPPMDILPTMERFLNNPANADLKKIPITTFGFSCDIDSKLLFDIAEMTNGEFNFIPESSMVGTTFINFIANSLATEYIKYEVVPAQTIPTDTRVYEMSEVCPNEQYEIIRYHTYQTLKAMCFATRSTNRVLNSNVKTSFDSLKYYIETTIHSFRTSELNPDIYTMLIELYKDFKSNNENEEQIYKAINSQQWFQKWGYHYLLSLSMAHKTRKCHNFRDKGVQSYGGTLFSELKDLVNDIFCQIPPPTPSAVQSNYGGRYGMSSSATSTATYVPVPNMSNYVNSSGPCFAPTATIKLADGSLVQLKDLNGSESVFIDSSKSAKSNISLRHVLWNLDLLPICV
jgi:Mg-chelatase subunit ChlD